MVLNIFVFLEGAGRRRSKQSNSENGTPAQLGRTNTMYTNPTSTGYGGFTYTTSGNRAQFYLNQIPYVAAQSSQTAEYVEWLTRYSPCRLSEGRRVCLNNQVKLGKN